MNAGFRRLNRIVLVVNGRCRTGKIVDLIDCQIDRERDVVANEFEPFIIEKMFDVTPCACEKFIETNDLGAL